MPSPATRETVGDMIVRHRKERLANPNLSERERASILSSFKPRSLRHETWETGNAPV